MKSLNPATAVAIFLALISPIPVLAQSNDPVWLQLDRAREAYYAGEYGDALMIIQKARQTKHEMTARQISVLETAFNPAEVRRAGDDLSLIRPVLVERDEKEALDTLDLLAKTRGAAGLGTSAEKTLAWLRRSDVFPEADFLEGLIHDAEGETTIALRLYLQAWENREFLDIPDQSTDILYRMAESSLGLGNRDTAEKDYLQILSSDPVYGTPDMPSATLMAMKNTLVHAGDTAKFIKLYRHHNDKAYLAAARLTDLYLRDDDGLDRAVNASILTACMAISMGDRVLGSRKISWDGTTLKSFFQSMGKSSELSSWASETKLWDSFLLLSRTLAASGNKAQAAAILSDLVSFCPDRSAARTASGLEKALSLRY